MILQKKHKSAILLLLSMPSNSDGPGIVKSLVGLLSPSNEYNYRYFKLTNPAYPTDHLSVLEVQNPTDNVF